MSDRANREMHPIAGCLDNSHLGALDMRENEKVALAALGDRGPDLDEKTAQIMAKILL